MAIFVKELPNDLLLRAYERAIELDLDEDFLEILRKELRERKIYWRMDDEGMNSSQSS